MTPLTREVKKYQTTGRGLERLIEQVTAIAYRFPSSQTGFTDEDSAEFVLQFLPRVRGLIERYRDTGQSFESYLGATMRWQLKSFAARRSADRIRDTALCGPGGDLHAEAESRLCRPVSTIAVHDGGRRQPASAGCGGRLTPGQCRRLLHMSLKMAEVFDESDYRRVASTTGCDPAWVLDCWHQLRAGCDAQRQRRAAFRARRDHAWFKIRCLQYRLQLVLEDEERQNALRKLAMWRRRYESARRVLDRMHPGPTHADIARVLNIPKGTVDSSVFYGKRELSDPEYLSALARSVPKT